MKKILFVLNILILSVSCSNKYDHFCECMKLGKKINDVNLKILKKPTSQMIKKEKELKKQQTEECSRYFIMSGKEMIELKKKCN